LVHYYKIRRMSDSKAKPPRLVLPQFYSVGFKQPFKTQFDHALLFWGISSYASTPQAYHAKMSRTIIKHCIALKYITEENKQKAYETCFSYLESKQHANFDLEDFARKYRFAMNINYISKNMNEIIKKCSSDSPVKTLSAHAKLGDAILLPFPAQYKRQYPDEVITKVMSASMVQVDKSQEYKQGYMEENERKKTFDVERNWNNFCKKYNAILRAKKKFAAIDYIVCHLLTMDFSELEKTRELLQAMGIECDVEGENAFRPHYVQQVLTSKSWILWSSHNWHLRIMGVNDDPKELEKVIAAYAIASADESRPMPKGFLNIVPLQQYFCVPCVSDLHLPDKAKENDDAVSEIWSEYRVEQTANIKHNAARLNADPEYGMNVNPDSFIVEVDD
jgi:hypothetical protein